MTTNITIALNSEVAKALCVHAANRAGAEMLYTEDLNPGQHQGRAMARHPIPSDE